MVKVQDVDELADGFYRVLLGGGFTSDKYITVCPLSGTVSVYHTSGEVEVFQKKDIKKTPLWRACREGYLYKLGGSA